LLVLRCLPLQSSGEAEALVLSQSTPSNSFVNQWKATYNDPMQIRIKRFDKNMPLPKYHTEGAAGFDLAARATVTIPAHAVGYVPLNVAVETPPDHFLLIATRGSTHKRGLMLANSVGIGDADFCGDDDEYQAALLNFTDASVTVERGDRIAQGIFIKFTRGEWDEVGHMENKTRGGFGSTGKR